MMAFELMNAQRFEINTAPGTDPGTYAVIAKGFNNAEVSFNEELDQTAYFDGGGFGETDVIGAQMTIALSGHRFYEDPAQDYIFSKGLELGPNRRTQFRWTEADGGVYEGECTIANITGPSGDAGAKGEISCEIHFNGKPEYTPPTA